MLYSAASLFFGGPVHSTQALGVAQGHKSVYYQKSLLGIHHILAKDGVLIRQSGSLNPLYGSSVPLPEQSE
jgi:hypothetical protein